MASVRLQPPSPFEFHNPDDWPRWKRRFEQFCQASGLSAEDDSQQVSTLLYCMGENAEDTLASTGISGEDRKRLAAVIAKFDAFFQVRKNVIFERARFNQRNQEAGESAEQFITSLYSLADNCAYGDLKDDLIRDRIVVGIRDKALSERLQLDPELTLEKAKQIVRQREAVQEQQQILKNGTSLKEEKLVDSLRQSKSNRSKGAPGKRQPVGAKQQKPPTAGNANKCSRCGKAPHARHLCPAKDAECYTCKRKGHYSSQCFSKTVADVSSTNEHRTTT